MAPHRASAKIPETQPGGTLSRIGDFVAELKRRRVFRALVGWGVFSFAVLQVVEPVLHAYHLPEWSLTAVVSVLAAGFPVTVLLAWIFDLGVEGITRTPPAAGVATGVPRARLVLLLLAVGVLAAAPGIGYLLFRSASASAKGEADAGKAGASIAVLPFANLSADREQEYFADGIAEEILNALAQIDGLRVAGRTSSFTFRGKSEDLTSIAQKLRVSTVLEGSVRREGNRVRVTAQLVDAGNGYHLWSQTFERELSGVFAIQDEIASAVVLALRGRLLSAGAGPPAARPTTTPEAYGKYLLARHLTDAGSPRAMRQAVTAAEECVALDPRFAPCWASLANALAWSAEWPTEEPMSAADRARFRTRAREAADRAVAIAPDAPDGYAIRAWLRLSTGPDRGWDWRGARADMDRAIALGLTDSDQICVVGRMVMASQGRLTDATAMMQRLTETDPLSHYAWGNLGELLTYQGRYREAARAFRVARDISGESWASATYPDESYALSLEGRGEEALAVARRIGDEYFRLPAEAIALHVLGRREESERAIAKAKETAAGRGAYQIATFHAFRGDREEAIAWYGRAIDEGIGDLVDILVDPSARRLAGDPGFKTLLARLGVPEGTVVR